MGHALSAQGRQALAQHFNRTAIAYGVAAGNPLAGQHFAATPTVAQTIVKKIVESANPFLASLRTIPVTEIKGQKVLLGLTGRVARRTDTSSTGERVPNRLVDTGDQDYELFKTEFDIALSYADIDAWAKFPNFADLYMQAVREAISNDILQAGWTGITAETATNIVSNPLLEDLNIGWLQKIRAYNSGSQYAIGTTEIPITLGTGGSYANLDEAVHDIKQTIATQFRGRGDHVALVSDDLLVSQEDVYYQTQGNTPTEKALLGGFITKAFGGLPTVTPPFFPDGTILITPLANLAVYYQDSSIRRLQRDWPSKDEVQEFNSMNMGYVVQEELACSLVENITLESAGS
jgi:P2 family phage major capsid protein